MIDGASDPLVELFGNAPSLADVEADIWKRLRRGAADWRHVMHCPVVGSLDPDGLPSQRVMVLRECDPSARLLRFHTDSRAGKVDAIGDGAPVSLLFYDPKAKIQIRAQGHGAIETEGERVDAAWRASTLFARRCYTADPAPGSIIAEPLSGLPPELEGVEPSEAEAAPGRANFALLMVTLERFEWFYLSHLGHRRAALCWASNLASWQGNWLIP